MLPVSSPTVSLTASAAVLSPTASAPAPAGVYKQARAPCSRFILIRE